MDNDTPPPSTPDDLPPGARQESLITPETVGDLPRETPAAAAVPANPGAPPPPAGDRDDAGEAWDPARHSDPPRRTAAGRWRKKTGNGALAAAGRPLSGANAGAKAKAKTTAPRPPAPRLVSEVPADDGAPAGDQTAEPRAAEAAPEPPPSLEDYAATAEGLARGAFGAAALAFGKAWEPDAGELEAWKGALARLWAHYRLPRLGPVPELLSVLVASIAKRRNDPTTAAAGSRVAVWLGLRRPAPPPAGGA